MNEETPLPRWTAFCSVVLCVGATARLLTYRRIHLKRDHVGGQLRFANGTSARIYRETVVEHGPIADPCVLMVAFRLRVVRGLGHTLFRWESILNTPLFAGFPGFVSKLWLRHDDNGIYRGIYQWDGAQCADHYARSLWRVLNMVCIRDSIHYIVIPALRRDDLIEDPSLLDDTAPGDPASWWRLVKTP